MHFFDLQVVVVSVCLFSAFGASVQKPVPIVLWHGIGDTCCAPGSIGGFKNFLEMNIPGVYVHSLKIGRDDEEEKLNTYFMLAKDQVSEACRQIQADPELQNGYHAVGFSQGGLLMRALAQTCASPRIINLVTFGGPHQGVYGYPQCAVSLKRCDILRRFLSFFVYNYVVQIAYVPIQYWHDPTRPEQFKKGSLFLADVNNVKEVKIVYRDNLMKLKNFVMVRFLKDQVVIPYQSSWFGFYKPKQRVKIVALNETELYRNDTLGLRQMDMQGKLHFLDINGPHMVFQYTWVKKNILPYLL